MTRFAYTAVALHATTGGLVSGLEEAPDERALRASLRGRGLVVIEARPERFIEALRARFMSQNLRRSESAWFFSTLRTLLAGSVPVESALGTLEELAPSPRLRSACAGVRDRLRGGASLASAVADAPGLAQPAHLALLRSGHESGRLAHVVTLIDASLATGEKLRRTVVSRLIYPCILLVAAIAAVWFLATFVIPRFAEMLESTGGTLPWPTRITMSLASVGVWVLPVIVVGGVALMLARDALLTPAARASLSRLALRTPIVGSLLWHGQGALVCDVVATMVQGGADLAKALDQAYEVVSSPAIAERLGQARRDVREGGDVGAVFAARGVLPPMPAAVLRVSVKGGDLVGGLRRATTACVEKQERLADRLMVLMEPAVILFMAGAVGWVVYSLIAGMLAMNDARGL